MAKTKIHFIITGGTIDGFYQPETETSQPSDVSIIPHYITDVIKPHFVPSYETLCMLDSGDITDTIRRKIIHSIRKTKAKRIIITHGTTTMAQTARFVDKHLGKAGKDRDKVIALTGAMVPLKDFALSDGGFNLGFTVAALECLKPGVYLCMNGEVFKAGEAVKNVKKARFEFK